MPLKKRFFLLLNVFFISVNYHLNAQIFVQKLSQDQILNLDSYVVTQADDTVYGRISTVSSVGGTISRLTLKTGGEKIKFDIEGIKMLSVLPDDFTRFEETTILPALKTINNKDFISVLPEDGRVFYETIRLPGRQEQYILTQLLNPGFDSKIKVYAHPDAESAGSTTVNGLAVDGGNDNVHFFSINGERPFQFDNWGYPKKAPERLFSNCEALMKDKLRWKDLPKHIWIYDQECE